MEQEDAQREWDERENIRKKEEKQREKEERRREKEERRREREKIQCEVERKERRRSEWDWYVSWREQAKERVMSRFVGDEEANKWMKKTFEYWKAEWAILDDESVEKVMDGWRRFLPAGEKVWNKAREETVGEMQVNKGTPDKEREQVIRSDLESWGGQQETTPSRRPDAVDIKVVVERSLCLQAVECGRISTEVQEQGKMIPELPAPPRPVFGKICQWVVGRWRR